MHRDTGICSPVKCFKNLSFCRRSLGKTSVKRGEITVQKCDYLYLLATEYEMPHNKIRSSMDYNALIIQAQSVSECDDAYQECVHADMTL